MFVASSPMKTAERARRGARRAASRLTGVVSAVSKQLNGESQLHSPLNGANLSSEATEMMTTAPDQKEKWRQFTFHNGTDFFSFFLHYCLATGHFRCRSSTHAAKIPAKIWVASMLHIRRNSKLKVNVSLSGDNKCCMMTSFQHFQNHWCIRAPISL